MGRREEAEGTQGAGFEARLLARLLASGATSVGAEELNGRGMEGLTLGERLQRLLDRRGDDDIERAPAR